MPRWVPARARRSSTALPSNGVRTTPVGDVCGEHGEDGAGAEPVQKDGQTQPTEQTIRGGRRIDAEGGIGGVRGYDGHRTSVTRPSSSVTPEIVMAPEVRPGRT